LLNKLESIFIFKKLLHLRIVLLFEWLVLFLSFFKFFRFSLELLLDFFGLLFKLSCFFLLLGGMGLLFFKIWLCLGERSLGFRQLWLQLRCFFGLSLS
jgi:hypothetical protein